MLRSAGTQRGKATPPKTTSTYNNTYNKGKSKQSFKSGVCSRHAVFTVSMAMSRYQDLTREKTAAVSVGSFTVITLTTQ